MNATVVRGRIVAGRYRETMGIAFSLERSEWGARNPNGEMVLLLSIGPSTPVHRTSLPYDRDSFALPAGLGGKLGCPVAIGTLQIDAREVDLMEGGALITAPLRLAPVRSAPVK